jgi:hypothetical protein
MSSLGYHRDVVPSSWVSSEERIQQEISSPCGSETHLADNLESILHLSSPSTSATVDESILPKGALSKCEEAV